LLRESDSQKLPDNGPDTYSFTEQRKYLEAFLTQLGAQKNVIFVAHDWGSALAFDWAYRHPNAVKGIVYMEAIVKPLSWEAMPEQGRNIFKALRSPVGEKMVLEQNSFIEINLPATIMRALTNKEMDEYRRPFIQQGEGRRVMLSWARQLPFEGEASEVTDIVNNYSQFLGQTPIPKLFIEGAPGTMQPAARELCSSWPEQTHIVVKGVHYVQEDSPSEIGVAISVWLQGLNKLSKKQ